MSAIRIALCALTNRIGDSMATAFRTCVVRVPRDWLRLCSLSHQGATCCVRQQTVKSMHKRSVTSSSCGARIA